MKKFIIPLIVIGLLVACLIISFFPKSNNNLKKIKVADTTLTSRTHIKFYK